MLLLLLAAFDVDAFMFSDDVCGEQVGDTSDLFGIVLAGFARFEVPGAVARTDLGLVPYPAAVVAADHAAPPP